MEDLYLNDFHRQNSEAAQREVSRMLLHPYSREQVLEQVARFKSHSASKRSANVARCKNIFYLSDLHDENVIRSREGNIFVVDCDIRINTPELRCGGTRTLTTDVEFL